MAALIFPGINNIKNTINAHPVHALVTGISIPIAAMISITPVKYITSVFKGINSGSIIAMPFVNAKCPKAVKTNIIDNAILPDKRYSNTLENILKIIRLIKNALSRTNIGFISIN
jgi:hypothetical protein